jgi:hypothetical protein
MVKRVVQRWVVPVEKFVAFVRSEIVFGTALRALRFGDASKLTSSARIQPHSLAVTWASTKVEPSKDAKGSGRWYNLAL